MDYTQYTEDRNFGCRISADFTYRGWRLLVMENELLRVAVLPEKGSDVWEFLYKPADVDFMWRTPQGLCNRALYTPTLSGPDGGFLDFYEGGWQEIAPSMGEGCEYRGAAYGLHGETWGLPWELTIESDTPTEVSAKLVCRLLKTPLVIEKRLALRSNEAVLHIDETITNHSEEQVDYVWGHHPTFGAPFLGPDCVLDVPAGTIAVHSFETDPKKRFEPGRVFEWPMMTTISGETIDASRIPGPECGGSDELCFTDMREGWYALTNTRKRLGFALEWDLETFPYLWWWQVFGGGTGYPWYGRTFNCGLEPLTSYPMAGLAEAVRTGTHRTLAPHASASAYLRAVAYSGPKRVRCVRGGCVVEGQ